MALLPCSATPTVAGSRCAPLAEQPARPGPVLDEGGRAFEGSRGIGKTLSGPFPRASSRRRGCGALRRRGWALFGAGRTSVADSAPGAPPSPNGSGVQRSKARFGPPRGTRSTRVPTPTFGTRTASESERRFALLWAHCFTPWNGSPAIPTPRVAGSNGSPLETASLVREGPARAPSGNGDHLASRADSNAAAACRLAVLVLSPAPGVRSRGPSAHVRGPIGGPHAAVARAAPDGGSVPVQRGPSGRGLLLAIAFQFGPLTAHVLTAELWQIGGRLERAAGLIARHVGTSSPERRQAELESLHQCTGVELPGLVVMAEFEGAEFGVPPATLCGPDAVGKRVPGSGAPRESAVSSGPR